MLNLFQYLIVGTYNFNTLSVFEIMRSYYVYIATNKHNTVFYTGVTNDIFRRMEEHKNKKKKGFTSKYNINKLIFVEETNDVTVAIEREKQLKNWRRQWKINLIKEMNPFMKDLIDELF